MCRKSGNTANKDIKRTFNHPGSYHIFSDTRLNAVQFFVFLQQTIDF